MRIPAILIAITATPLLAQTTPTKTTAHPAAAPVHHTAAATTASGCATVPELSPKIPSLPAGSSCPKPLYTITHRPAITLDYASPMVSPALREILNQKAETFSLDYVDTKVGTGPLAEPHMWYTVHYTGYLVDGTKFDSSVDRGQPISFPYGAHRVIEGWDTGFEGMRIGGKRRLYVPYQLGLWRERTSADSGKGRARLRRRTGRPERQPAGTAEAANPQHTSDRCDSAGRGDTCSEADADACGHRFTTAGDFDHTFELHATGAAVYDDPAEELTELPSPSAR